MLLVFLLASNEAKLTAIMSERIFGIQIREEYRH